MKKKLIALVLVCVLACSVIACKPHDAAVKTLSPAPVKESMIPEEESTAEEESTQKDVIDLTTMGSTMIFSTVYDMMANPIFYLGHTVKVRGPYYALPNEQTGQYYHFILVADAAACCQQGIEFIWNGEHDYPYDYPADMALTEIEGVFSSYKENGNTYYYLGVDDVHAVE